MVTAFESVDDTRDGVIDDFLDEETTRQDEQNQQTLRQSHPPDILWPINHQGAHQERKGQNKEPQARSNVLVCGRQPVNAFARNLDKEPDGKEHPNSNAERDEGGRADGKPDVHEIPSFRMRFLF